MFASLRNKTLWRRLFDFVVPKPEVERPRVPFLREDLLDFSDKESKTNNLDITGHLILNSIRIDAKGTLAVRSGATFECLDLSGIDGTLIVEGHFVGSAYVNYLLVNGGVVDGYVRYERLEIINGGVFNGRLKRGA